MASLSEMCISTDSALIHIGASLGRKIFGLYGPFPAHIRMSTYINYDYVEPKNCPCAPCFRHGHLNCANSTNGNSNCYDMIDMDECFDKIEKLLKK
jgi:ADP-heptose:LPS heptosyltransferase